MADTYYVETNETNLPLELVVDNFATGPVTGLTPTVAVRDASTTDFYLDWNDNTFKNAGWGLKDAPMSEISPPSGIYARSLNVALLNKPSGFKMSAQYSSTAPGASGIDVEVIFLTDQYAQVSLTRKYATNRLEAAGGNPGTLTLFDDDNVTQLEQQTLRDFANGPVADTPGSPAKRGKAVP